MALKEVAEELRNRKRFIAPVIRNLDTGETYVASEIDRVPKGLDPERLAKDERRFDLATIICGPFATAIPRWVHPNTITLINHACNWLLLVLALYPRTCAGGNEKVFIGCYSVCALVNFITMMLDCLDGMHARATKQTSKLGELLDHFLDSIHVPMIAGGTCFAMNMTNLQTALTMPCNVLLYNSQLIVYHYTFNFVATSGIEAQIGVSGLYLLAAAIVTTPEDSFIRVWVPWATCAVGMVVAIRLSMVYYARFSTQMWRKHILYMFYNVVFSALFLMGGLTMVEYILVVSFASFRITGMYVMQSVVKQSFSGSDYTILVWAAVLSLFHFAAEPIPLELFYSRLVPHIGNVTQGIVLQSVLPYVMCLHMTLRNLSVLRGHYPRLKNM